MNARAATLPGVKPAYVFLLALALAIFAGSAVADGAKIVGYTDHQTTGGTTLSFTDVKDGKYNVSWHNLVAVFMSRPDVTGATESKDTHGSRPVWVLKHKDNPGYFAGAKIVVLRLGYKWTGTKVLSEIDIEGKPSGNIVDGGATVAFDVEPDEWVYVNTIIVPTSGKPRAWGSHPGHETGYQAHNSAGSPVTVWGTARGKVGLKPTETIRALLAKSL